MMFFIMTIRTNKFQINELIIIPISVFMMDLKYLMPGILASFAFFASDVEKSDFQRLLRFHFVSWAVNSVVYTSSIFI